MSSHPFQPSVEQIKQFLGAVLVTAAGYAAYTGVEQLATAAFFLGTAFLVLLSRELGQRIVAHQMDAYTEVKLSFKGSMMTALGAFTSLITALPIIMLFPVENSYSMNRYEQWGKSIDVIWMKREFWLVSGGLLFLITGWLISYTLGQLKLAEAYALFLIFQLMPFDYSGIPTGRLDGSIVLRTSGFLWLFYFSVAWICLGLIWV